MKSRLVNFIHLLRESNIRISIAETIEACKALSICDIYDKQQFKIALMATLIKQHDDLPTFNKVFDLYFAEPLEKNKDEQISQEEFQQMMEQMMQQMQDDSFNELENEQQNGEGQSNSGQPSEMDNEFQKYDKNKINKDLYKNGSESDIQQMAQQLASSRKYEDWEANDIDNVCQRMMISNELEYSKVMAKHETRKSQHEDIEQKYQMLKQELKEAIEKQMVKQFGEEIILDLVENENIMDKDMGELSIEELEKIQQIIKKIARKLATHVSRKEKHSKKGRINIRKTIRSSIQYGTTSSELKYKNKKKTKNELVVLCDISGSVYMYVNFMLQLVVGIQNVFDKVTSFIFVDTCKDITEKILNSENLERTLAEFLMDRTLGFGTDYGNTFKVFSQQKDIFNKKTVLIIMGDAENTGNTTGEEYLKQISDKCKVTYWLQPKEKEHWYNPYSELEKYKIYCKDVYQCNTLRQLEDFIRQLIKL
jgi:uncharacterized protein with von Willebrand factor type A (vWA) domain